MVPLTTDIHIENGSSIADVTVHYEGGRVESYSVKDMDFLTAFQKCYKPDASILGQMPDGYVDALYVNDENFKVCIEVPAGIRNITYYGDVFFVPFPALLFRLTVREGKVVASKVVAELNGSCYCYPFGNVYTDGRICWGSTVLPPITCLQDVNQIIQLFFGSETNNDLYSAGRNVANKKQYVNQRGLFEFLEKKRKFPKQDLIPIYPMRKSEFIKEMMTD